MSLLLCLYIRIPETKWGRSCAYSVGPWLPLVRVACDAMSTYSSRQFSFKYQLLCLTHYGKGVLAETFGRMDQWAEPRSSSHRRCSNICALSYGGYNSVVCWAAAGDQFLNLSLHRILILCINRVKRKASHRSNAMLDLLFWKAVTDMDASHDTTKSSGWSACSSLLCTTRVDYQWTQIIENKISEQHIYLECFLSHQIIVYSNNHDDDIVRMRTFLASCMFLFP